MDVDSQTSAAHTSASTSYPSSDTRRSLSRATNGRPRGRPRTATFTVGGEQQLICAISESRGISPIVGMAFVNLSTSEAVLCQISDNQTYTRTEHKLIVYQPTEILFMDTAIHPTKSKLYSLVQDNLPGIRITPTERKFWAEATGMDYIQRLAFKQDVEAIKVSVEGNFYATCCMAAVCSL